MARFRDLPRKSYDPLLVHAAVESLRVHPGRLLHVERRDLQPMLIDSKYGSAPSAGPGEFPIWAVLRRYSPDRYRRDVELQRPAAVSSTTRRTRRYGRSELHVVALHHRYPGRIRRAQCHLRLLEPGRP